MFKNFFFGGAASVSYVEVDWSCKNLVISDSNNSIIINSSINLPLLTKTQLDSKYKSNLWLQTISILKTFKTSTEMKSPPSFQERKELNRVVSLKIERRKQITILIQKHLRIVTKRKAKEKEPNQEIQKYKTNSSKV